MKKYTVYMPLSPKEACKSQEDRLLKVDEYLTNCSILVLYPLNQPVTLVKRNNEVSHYVTLGIVPPVPLSIIQMTTMEGKIREFLGVDDFVFITEG